MALKLKPEVKNLWIEGLTSGEFNQGTDYLTTVDDDGKEHDCCLGVLCKLAVRNGVALSVTTKAEDHVTYKEYDTELVGLPSKVIEWAFEPVEYPDSLEAESAYDPEVDGHPLSGHNDGLTAFAMQPKDFSQIADLIRDNL